MDYQELRPSRAILPFPKFCKPAIQGYFSVDKDRRYQDSLCNLKYLKTSSQVNFNLNKGNETYVDKPQCADEEKLNHILEFLMHNQTLLKQQTAPDFVCFRGLLSRLMLTPYELGEPWIVLATKYKNTIYLCAEETQKKKSEKGRRTERDIKFLRYGFKFESFVLSNDPLKDPPGSKEPVFEAEEFCAMFTTLIDGKKILYGAETDGVISKEPCKSIDDLRRLPLVEVKVKRRETNERQVTNFYRFKAQKWWLQSFLVGINEIHVGLRNDDGIVDEVRRVPIKDLADEAKRNDLWHGTVSANFLSNFLKKVSRDLKQTDDPLIVYRYNWDVQNSDFVTCRKLEGHRHAFLPKQFVETVQRLY